MSFHSLVVKPHVIISTKTWEIHNPNLLNIDGYKFYYNVSKINRSDGVAIYVASNLISEAENIIIEELIIPFLKIIIINVVIRVSAFYRCHKFSKLNFIEKMKIYLKKSEKLKNHFLVGDFNINILDDDLINNQFLGELLAYGFYPLFKSITRPNPNSNYTRGSCIDNFYIKSTLTSQRIIYQQLFNDHYPIFCGLELGNIEDPINNTSNFNNKKINYNKLFKIGSKLNWSNIYKIENPDLAINTLIKMIQSCINKASKHNKKKK